MSVLNRIENNKVYSIREIHKNGFLFWYKDYGSIYRLVLQDLKGANILQAEVKENNYRNFYKIKGKYIKEYIKKKMNGDI